MLPIKGIQKTSLIDYPPYTVSTIFIGSCNFRCPYCQNPDLILNLDDLPDIPEQELFSFLKKRKKWLDGICITGGEPTLYEDLYDFIKKIKELKLKVKLDTNGTNPDLVKKLIDNDLVDFIAMDIKAPLEKYDEITKVKVNKEKIQETIDILKQNKVDYEFRITVVPGLIDEDDFDKIGKWLKGTKKFFIQQFSPKICLDKKFEKTSSFSQEELSKFKEMLEKYIERVEIRD